MVYAEVRLSSGILIEEQEMFHVLPNRGDIIDYGNGKDVEVLRAEHTPINSEGFYFQRPARVTVIVREING